MRPIFKIIWNPGKIDVCPSDSLCLLFLHFNDREKRPREQLQFLRKPGIINDTGYTRFQYLAQRFYEVIFGAYRQFIGDFVYYFHRAGTIIFIRSDISYSRKGDLPIWINFGNNPINPN